MQDGRHAARFAALQSGYIARQTQLWTAMLGEQGSATVAPVTPEPGDRRFAAKEWQDNPYHAYVKQSYLLASRFLAELVDGIDNVELDAKSTL